MRRAGLLLGCVFLGASAYDQSPTCQLEENYDCWGNDISNTPLPKGGTAQSCCSLCTATSGCGGFVLDQYDPQGKRVPTCYFKTECTARNAKPGATAGSTKRPAPGSQYTNHYESENPLGIKPDPVRSNNYFIILGDWGKFGGPSSGDCMDSVAKMILRFAAKQKAAGKKLLFVAVVGDNVSGTAGLLA